MKAELIQSFLLSNKECFNLAQIPEIQAKLEALDDSKASGIMAMDLQKPTVILLIAILLGWDRFFLDDIGLGILKVVTCYGVGIWWLIDIFSAKSRTQEYNYRKFNEALMFLG